MKKMIFRLVPVLTVSLFCLSAHAYGRLGNDCITPNSLKDAYVNNKILDVKSIVPKDYSNEKTLTEQQKKEVYQKLDTNEGRFGTYWYSVGINNDFNEFSILKDKTAKVSFDSKSSESGSSDFLCSYTVVTSKKVVYLDIQKMTNPEKSKDIVE